MSDPTLFKPIGEIVTETDALPEVADDAKELEEPVFEREEGEEREVQQIESLCMQCGQNGVTRMLLTQIPFFKEIVVMSFSCDHCGNSNTEIQAAGQIQPKGCAYTLHILSPEDLNRQLVKSATATVTIPELQLTIPASRGQLTNVEGLLRDTVRDLGIDQPVRKIMEPETYKRIEDIRDRLRECLPDDHEDDDDALNEDRVIKPEDEEEDKMDDEGQVANKEARHFKPFTMLLDDPSGNSFIQFLGSPGTDTKWTMRAYNRTKEQNVLLGLAAPEEQTPAPDSTTENGNATTPHRSDAAPPPIDPITNLPDPSLLPEELFSFPGTCSSCSHPIATIMQKLNIPHFKDIIIMSTNCDYCGYRDNEVKSGGAVSELGKKIILKVEDDEDLSRDLLKSETCSFQIPEIDLFLQPGTLGGRFTTVEGLLNQVYDELSTKVFRTVDSGSDSEVGEFEIFLGKLKQVMSAEIPFTLILDDPVSNSYLQNLYAPDPDPNIEIITYERTHDQNEDLGLNDMVLEGYGEDEKSKPKPDGEQSTHETVSKSDDQKQ